MSPDPATHKCPLDTLDYSAVDEGVIFCARTAGGCGRRWEFVDGRGWMPSPPPVGARLAGDRGSSTVVWLHPWTLLFFAGLWLCLMIGMNQMNDRLGSIDQRLKDLTTVTTAPTTEPVPYQDGTP